MSGVPDCEMNTLLRDTADAVNLAVAGEPCDGMSLLAAGLRRAQSMLGAEHWSEELVLCYRRALSQYCREYQVPSVPDRTGTESGA